MNKVSIYIPCYNGTEYLKKCLDSVLKQAYPAQEIIVVDDGSEDEIADALAGYPVKLIRHSRNAGIAAARNSAISNAKEDFIASVDVDCLLDTDWLGQCMSNFMDPKIAAVGGKLVEDRVDKTEYRWRAMHLKQHWGDQRIVNPLCLSGSNTVIRKSAFNEVGLYNEKRFKKNYEDVDMCLRLKKNGFNLIYEPKAIARHIKTETPASVLHTFWRWKLHDYTCAPRHTPFFIFYLVNLVKVLAKDIINGRLEFISMDILNFPLSAYFGVKKILKNDRG